MRFRFNQLISALSMKSFKILYSTYKCIYGWGIYVHLYIIHRKLFHPLLFLLSAEIIRFACWINWKRSILQTVYIMCLRFIHMYFYELILMHVQVYTYIAVKYIKRAFVGALLMKLSMCGFLQFFCFHAALIDIFAYDAHMNYITYVIIYGIYKCTSHMLYTLPYILCLQKY